jgi:MFS family permease
MGAPAGVAIATLAFLLVAQLPDEAFFTWGWRVPFLFSAVLVIVGLFIRIAVSESPEFARVRDLQQRVRVPAVQAFRTHPKQIFLVAGIYLSQGVFAYIVMSYFVQYGTTVVGLDRAGALLSVFVAGVIATVLYAVFGAVSDKWGRKSTYMIGAVAMLVTIGPALVLINTGQLLLFAAALIMVFGVAMAPAGGATGSLFSLLFAPEVRYSGASIGYTISQIGGSAFAPLIAAALYGAYGTLVPLFIYLVGVSLITVVSLLLVGGPWGRREAAAQDDAAAVKTPVPATSR